MLQGDGLEQIILANGLVREIMLRREIYVNKLHHNIKTFCFLSRSRLSNLVATVGIIITAAEAVDWEFWYI